MDQGTAGQRGGTDRPLVRVCADQVVAANIRRWRKVAGLTQEELGERLGGWSKANVSAAERSWDGKRIRRFDADTTLALAAALDVPLAAMFLPPPDDGNVYILDMPSPALNGAGLGALFGYLFPDPGKPAVDDSPVAIAYREAFTAAVHAYMDPARGEEMVAYLEEMTAAERRADLLARLTYQAEALRTVLEDVESIRAAVRAEDQVRDLKEAQADGEEHL